MAHACFEYFTCRKLRVPRTCGPTPTILRIPSYLWQESGESFASVTGAVSRRPPPLTCYSSQQASASLYVQPNLIFRRADLIPRKRATAHGSYISRRICRWPQVTTRTTKSTQTRTRANSVPAESVVKQVRSANPRSKIIKPKATSHSRRS